MFIKSGYTKVPVCIIVSCPSQPLANGTVSFSPAATIIIPVPCPCKAGRKTSVQRIHGRTTFLRSACQSTIRMIPTGEYVRSCKTPDIACSYVEAREVALLQSNPSLIMSSYSTLPRELPEAITEAWSLRSTACETGENKLIADCPRKETEGERSSRRAGVSPSIFILGSDLAFRWSGVCAWFELTTQFLSTEAPLVDCPNRSIRARA